MDPGSGEFELWARPDFLRARSDAKFRPSNEKLRISTPRADRMGPPATATEPKIAPPSDNVIIVAGQGRPIS